MRSLCFCLPERSFRVKGTDRKRQKPVQFVRNLRESLPSQGDKGDKVTDAIIIGAGPAGSSAGKKLAEAGFSVKIYDRRQQLGVPVRCGEGLDERAEVLIGKIPDKCIDQKIVGARVYAPNGRHIIEIRGQNGFILNRKIFDKWLAEQAVKAGAELQTNTIIEELVIENGFVKGVKGKYSGKKFEESAKVVISATGAESPIARQAGIDTTCKLNLVDTCLQYKMSNVGIDQNFIHIYLGNEIARRGYAWIFPKGDSKANVGVGIIPQGKTPEYFLKKFIQRDELKNASIYEVNAGAVPVGGLLKDMVSDGFLVCGEAAHHVNPIHGGGIKEAIISGQLAADVIIEAKDYSKKSLGEFNKLWWKKRGNRLAKVEKLREVVEKLSDDDLNTLADSFKAEDLVEFTRGNRLSVLANVLMKKPGLIALARHLI